MGSSCGLLIDPSFGELRQLLVRRLLLVEILLQQRYGLSMTHRFSPGDDCSVCTDLEVLGALAGGDQAGVHRGLVKLLVDDRLAFLDDPGDAIAMLAARPLIEALEYLL